MKLYHSLEYKDKIKLVGFIKDVDSYLAKSDIFLFPSYGEGFGNAFIEAIASQMVCLSYDNTSFQDFEELELYFHKVKTKNIDELQQKLLFCVLNLKKEKEKCMINVSRVENIFSYQNELQKFLKILE
jgi:glycosyltransferase involved in cell wall biosynthesis